MHRYIERERVSERENGWLAPLQKCLLRSLLIRLFVLVSLFRSAETFGETERRFKKTKQRQRENG